MKLFLYNTESRRLEEFIPKIAGQVKMYTCGPTVYNFAHIGNFRTYVFEDLLRRTLKYFGYQVTQVMNLTDVDDKTLKGAMEKGISLKEFTDPFIQAFFEDLRRLNIEPVEHYPAATSYIDQMVKVIEDLLDKKMAYKGSDGSIYYSIKKFPRYGCLSHLKLDELEVGASERIIQDEYDKDNAADFVLWKACDPERDGAIFWESSLGRGRPGWHLECSTMAISLLGQDTIDIHVGGVDNMFPHHENEIAQSEAYTGNRFVNYWMHAEHLLVDHKKMSKSLGNFYTLRDLLNRGWSGQEVRYMLMQTHYKTQLNFTFEGLEASRATLNRLNECIQRLLDVDQESGESVKPLVERASEGFQKGLGDDINISVSLAVLFDFVREVNGLIDASKLGQAQAQAILDLLKRFDTVLGVMTFEKKEVSIPIELQEALEKRILARQEKNYKLSDELRDYIHARGYVIEDTAKGARLKKL
jgi:cysteinyl-tRNA synthetase